MRWNECGCDVYCRRHLEKLHVTDLRLQLLRQANFDIKPLTYRIILKVKFQVSLSKNLFELFAYKINCNASSHLTFFLFEACVNAAREGHSAELNRLRSELKTIIQNIESMEERKQHLEQESALLLWVSELVDPLGLWAV